MAYKYQVDCIEIMWLQNSKNVAQLNLQRREEKPL